MNEVLLYIVAAVTAFLFSGVNPSIILSKLIYHEDIREKGSGNPGFTNFKRVYGNRYAWFVFALDILKCVIFCAVFGALFDKYYGTYQLGVAFTGFFAMLGHCFPVGRQGLPRICRHDLDDRLARGTRGNGGVPAGALYDEVYVGGEHVAGGIRSDLPADRRRGVQHGYLPRIARRGAADLPA